MAKRQNFSSGTSWEASAGYSRCVRIGNVIEVAGTTAVENGEVIGPGDAAIQARAIFEKIKFWLEEAGGSLKDVVRTRMYVTNIEDWEKVAQVHGEVFGEVRPASTLVGIEALVDERLVVEIEATAMIED